MSVVDAVDLLEVAFAAYEKGWHWTQIKPLLLGPLFETYVIGQLLILSVIPSLTLAYVVLSGIKGRLLLILVVQPRRKSPAHAGPCRRDKLNHRNKIASGLTPTFRDQNVGVNPLANASAIILLLQVLFMRFNVVVGGQLISKPERGFVEYDWELLSKEGPLTAIVLFSAPFIAYFIISQFIPILSHDDRAPLADDAP